MKDISTMCFESLPDYSERLNQILDSCTNEMGGIMSASFMLCGLFALFYIGNIVWQSWCKGDSINIYALFRPFVIGLIILHFNSFVKVLDGLCQWINKPTVELVRNYSSTNLTEMVKSLEMGGEVMMNTKERMPGEGAALNFVWDSVTGLFHKKGEEGAETVDASWKDDLANIIVSLFMNRIVNFLSIISSLCGAAILTAAFVSKLILIYLGPYAFALSLTPYFSRSLPSWLGRYITVSLYAPCINIVCFAIMCIYHNASPVFQQGAEFGFGYFFFLSLAASLSFLSVPSIANYVVESCGAGGITSESRGVVRKLVQLTKTAATSTVNPTAAVAGYVKSKAK